MKFDKVIIKRIGKTVYLSGDKMVKVFDSVHYNMSAIFNEALNHARVEETGLSIPKLLEMTKIDGNWAIVYEHIVGKTLEELMIENPSKCDEYMELFVQLQIEAHSKTNNYLNISKRKLSERINNSTLASDIKYNLLSIVDSMPKHNHLLHGDFNPTNIIIRESDGKPFIIDWAHATQGNGSADAAMSYLLFYLNGDFIHAEQYLDLYCDHTSTAKQYVQKWIPIVAASLLINSPAEKVEFLKHYINVSEYN